MDVFMILVILLLLCCVPAAAQTVYKCTVAGKVVYGDRPCDGGVVAELAVPTAPSPDKDAIRTLAAQKALLAKLEKQRLTQEAQDAKAAAREHKAAAVTARRCAKLRLQQGWLDDAVQQAMSEQRAAARQKAQRHRQTMAIECPG